MLVAVRRDGRDFSSRVRFAPRPNDATTSGRDVPSSSSCLRGRKKYLNSFLLRNAFVFTSRLSYFVPSIEKLHKYTLLVARVRDFINRQPIRLIINNLLKIFLLWSLVRNELATGRYEYLKHAKGQCDFSNFPWVLFVVLFYLSVSKSKLLSERVH